LKSSPASTWNTQCLYESFLAGRYEKADELDDSGGNFGQFVHSLYIAWLKARQVW
jgi:hypothetical protein